MAWLPDRTRARALEAGLLLACVLAGLAIASAQAGGTTAPVATTASNGRSPALSPGNAVEVVQTTADLRQHLQRLADQYFTSAAPKRGTPVITVDDRIRYQRVQGVGAAMTDTSAWLIYDELGPGLRARVIDNLFGLSGINLNFTLVPIGASDFTMNGTPYTYDDLPKGQTDPLLQHFSVEHDEAYVLPALRQMLSVNPQTEVFAVPWTPPAWMKANNALHNLGHHGTLLPAAYGPLANYFVKFIEAYGADGVPISAIAPENEPHSPAPFPGMELPEPTEAQFITQYLQPALRAAHVQARIYGGDTAWQNPSYPEALLSSPARSSIAGIAWHCYSGIPYVISRAHAAAPGLDHIVTECSPGISPYTVPEVVIGSMRNWATTVALWNLALDPAGGPVEPPDTGCHGCTGLVTINERTHTVGYNLAYYQLGQLGRFVHPGASRIDTNHFVSYYHLASGANGASSGLDDAAFVNPDGSRVLLAYNNSGAAITFAVTWDGRSFTYTLPAGATVTFAWNRSAATAQAAVAVNAVSGQQYVFWQGADGFLREGWSDGLRWSGPVRMSSWGRTASAPAVAVGADNRQYVFWQGANGHLFEAWYELSRWNGPRDVTDARGWGTASSAPAVAINPVNDHQHVVWRGTDGRIREAWFNGVWRGPSATRWQTASAPAIAVGNDGHQYVFWEATNGDVEEAWYDGRWHGPQDMTASRRWPKATSAPAVAVNPATDHQYVFWRDDGGHVDEAYAGAGGWHDPQDMSTRYGWGPSLSAPGAAVTDNGSQYAFWRAPAGNIRQASYDNGSWHVVDLNWR